MSKTHCKSDKAKDKDNSSQKYICRKCEGRADNKKKLCKPEKAG